MIRKSGSNAGSAEPTGPARSGRPDDKLREAHAECRAEPLHVGTSLRSFAHPTDYGCAGRQLTRNTPTTQIAMPTSASGASFSPNSPHAISAVTGGVR